MKLSKNLLSTIAVGLAMGATVSLTSCADLREQSEIEPVDHPEKEVDDKCNGETTDWECGPCGMG